MCSQVFHEISLCATGFVVALLFGGTLLLFGRNYDVLSFGNERFGAEEMLDLGGRTNEPKFLRIEGLAGFLD